MSELAKVENKQVAAPITPAQMLQMAVEQGADLDKLEKLMDLQERWESNLARQEYTKAMSGFRSQCPAIARTRTGHNIKYAGLAESLDTIKSLLSQCGLSHSWNTQQDGPLIKVECVVTHESGHSERTSLAAAPDTSGSKNSIQAIGSTVSYLERYTLFAILGLASQDMDNDGNPDTPVDVQEEFAAAQSMKQLGEAFKRAWNQYPNARKELTLLKDARKKELTQ